MSARDNGLSHELEIFRLKDEISLAVLTQSRKVY